jgi:hypothetical protein
MDNDPDERARKKRTKENKGFSVFDLILFYFLNSGEGDDRQRRRRRICIERLVLNLYAKGNRLAPP